MTASEATSWLTARAAAILQIPPHYIDPAQPFTSLGMDSMSLLELTGDLAAWVGRDLPPSIVWEHPSIDALAAYIAAAPQVDEPPLMPVSRDRPIPQTYAQERMWREDRAKGPDSRQNGSKVYLIMGEGLDAAILAKAVAQLIERHESLRTTFDILDEQPVQVVHAKPPVELLVVDLSHDPDARTTALSDIAARKRQPFDLAAGPLSYFVLYVLNAAEHILYTVRHHILYDSKTGDIILRELAELYRQGVGSGTQPLPALPIQVADFAVWQRSWLSKDGPAYQRQLAWWNKLLGKREPAAAGHSLRWLQPPAQPDVTQSKKTQHLSLDNCNRLRKLASKEGTTFATLTLAACFVALAKTGTSSGALVGSYLSDRRRPQLQRLLGLFVNLVAIPLPAGLDGPFREVLQTVHTIMSSVSANQDFPFENLVEARAQEGLYAPHPQVIFNHTAKSRPDSYFAPGLEIETLSGKKSGTRPMPWGMSVRTHETIDGLTILVAFDTGIYNPERVDQVLANLLQVLQAAAPD